MTIIEIACIEHVESFGVMSEVRQNDVDPMGSIVIINDPDSTLHGWDIMMHEMFELTCFV